MLREEPAAALGERLVVEKEAAMDEACRAAYTGAGTQVRRGVRLVLVVQLDNQRSVLDSPRVAEDNRGSEAAVAGASVSPAVGCH